MALTQSASTMRAQFVLDWKSAMWAGLIAGAIFLLMEMVLITLTGMGSPWGPPRMMAAMVLGQDVLPPPATFDFEIVMVAMMVHFALSIIYAFILGWIISRRHMAVSAAIGVGAAFGLFMYLVNFYGFAPVLFPWFTEARTWVSLVSHVIYGLVLGWSYSRMTLRYRHSIGGTQRSPF